ncbi:MAG TPA: hypothetical protein VK858_00805 [Longimicrobiales bacterium]|nr:hypothetical protein [Longimicrobiales bacterium]
MSTLRRSTHRRNAVSFLVLLGALPASGAAQSVAVGDRVRVRAPILDRGPVVGHVLQVDADGFILGTSPLELQGGSSEEADRWTVRFDDLSGLERSTGRKGHGLTGAIIGSAVGLVVGLVVADGCPEDDCTLVEAAYAPLSHGMQVVGITGLGGLTGLLVGTMIRTDTWQPVHIDPR